MGGEGPIYYYTQHAQSGWARGFFWILFSRLIDILFFGGGGVMRLVLLIIRTFRFGLPFFIPGCAPSASNQKCQ